MESIIRFLKTNMETPTPFSWFHIIFICLTAIVTTILIIKEKNCNDKKLRLIILISLIIIVILEIIKQIVFGYNLDTHKLTLEWVNFPFQFCSCPYYIYPLLVFLKDGKIRKTLIAFTATYVFFGGFGYFFFPVSFCGYLFINLQTMIHHGTMICIGIFLMVHEFNNINYKEVLKGLIPLVIYVLIAISLNEIVNEAFPGTYVNLCELNPRIPTSAPVFSDILNALGYFMFVLVYIVGFLAFATIVYFAEKGIIILVRKIKKA